MRGSRTVHVLVLALLLSLCNNGTAVEWEMLVISRPLPGFEYAGPEEVVIEVKAAGLFAEADAEAWSWELVLDRGASSALTFNPTRPAFAVRMNHVVPGQHEIQLVLKNKNDGSSHVESVFFFVADPQLADVDILHKFEDRSRENMPARRQNFMRWISDNAMVSGVEIREDEFGGNALFATQDLEDDFLVATIPYNLTLSPEGVAHTRFPALFAQLYADTRVPPDLVTALLLLVELHAGEERRTQDENEQASSKQQASERDQSGSFFAPYIELLPPPSRLDGAYSWGDTEWASLKFSPTCQQHASAMWDYFTRVYARLFSVVLASPPMRELPEPFPPGLFSRQKITWALGLVLSRAWSDVGYKKRSGFHRLLPLADIANHRNTADLLENGIGVLHVELYDEEQEVRLVMKGRVPRGAEVFTSYGDYSNAELLPQYGFALPNNRHHRISLPTPALVAAAEEESVWWRAEMERGRKLEAEAAAVLEGGVPSPALLEYYRLEVLTRRSRESLVQLAVSGVQMPLPLELRALHRLTRALRRERERRWEVLDACREEGGFRLCGAEEEEEEEEEGVCLGTECRARTKTERVLSLVESMALQELETLDQSLDLVSQLWLAQLDREEDDPDPAPPPPPSPVASDPAQPAGDASESELRRRAEAEAEAEAEAARGSEGHVSGHVQGVPAGEEPAGSGAEAGR